MGCVPRRWHHFAFPPPVTEESTSALTLVITAHYHSSRSTGYVLVCVSLRASDTGHLFLCLLATCLSLGKDSAGGKKSVQVFTLFWRVLFLWCSELNPEIFSAPSLTQIFGSYPFLYWMTAIIMM